MQINDLQKVNPFFNFLFRNNTVLKIMGNFLRRKIDQIESKKMFEEKEGVDNSDFLIEIIEKSVRENDRINETDANVIKFY